DDVIEGSHHDRRAIEVEYHRLEQTQRDGGRRPATIPLILSVRCEIEPIRFSYQSASTAMASMTSRERIGSTRISSSIEPSSANTVTLGVTALMPPSVNVPGPVTPS